jgi:hypothetical protein
MQTSLLSTTGVGGALRPNNRFKPTRSRSAQHARLLARGLSE